MARTDLTEEKRLELIKAIQIERNKYNDMRMDITDHVYALSYLSTGAIRVDKDQIDEYDLLDAAINDTEQLYKDFCS